MSANCSDLFSDQFDGERALKHIQNQVEFGPRILSNPEAKKQTLDYMEEHLRPFATRTTRQSFSFKDLEGVNLWATFVSDHQNANQNRLMLGAHWDTRPFADRDTQNINLPIIGANDGASGVGVLLEIARMIQKDSLKIDTQFVRNVFTFGVARVLHRPNKHGHKTEVYSQGS